MTTLKCTWSLVLTGALVTAACGDSKSSMLPTAPSAVGAITQSQEAGLDGVSGPTAKGGIPGPPEDKGKKPDQTPGGGKAPANTSPGAPTAKKVEIEGLITGKSGDSIVVNGQQVVVPPACPIRHGQTMFAFSDLNFGDRVHVRASRTTTESDALPAPTSLIATEVILQNPGDGEGSGDDTPSNLVSVMATDSTASESPVETGTFTLTRAGSAALLAAGLTVNYTVGGTSSIGEYAPLSGTVTFDPGAATATVTVTPIADVDLEGSETVVLTLSTVAPYELGSPATATVIINDTNLPLVSVVAFDSTASETPANEGRFRFTRTGSTASPLVVTFTLDGTATPGVDYQALTGTVTIPAGALFADVVVTTLKDGVNQEADETVIVTVTDGALFNLGATSVATVTISE